MATARNVALGSLAVLAGLAGITGWALESGGVAVIETETPTGAPRRTHVWYAEPDGELWLEAGTPENPWFTDVQRTPFLRFETEASEGRYAVRPIDDPSGHERIRTLMREKYGLRDRWVALLFDTSRSLAVRLVPLHE